MVYLDEYVRWHCTASSLQQATDQVEPFRSRKPALEQLDMLTVTYDAMLSDASHTFVDLIKYVEGQEDTQMVREKVSL